MRTISAGTLEAIGSGDYAHTWLLLFDLAEGQFGFWPGIGTLNVNGIDYVGAGSLITIEQIDMGVDLSSSPLTVSLRSIPPEDQLAPSALSSSVILHSFDSLLHGDGPDGSTTILDSGTGGHTWTIVGNVQVDYAQSVFGGSSLLFDGMSGRLVGDDTSGFIFGTGDFTIEFWVRHNGTGAEHDLVSWGSTNLVWISTADDIRLFSSASGLQIGGPIVANVFHHIRLARSSSFTRLFLDGILQFGFVDTTNYSGARITFGDRDGGLFPLNGWMDEIAVFKGTALSTTSQNFTPPTLPYAIVDPGVLSPDLLATIDNYAYKNRPARLSLAYFNPTTGAAITVMLWWQGYVDVVSHEETIGGDYILRATLEPKSLDHSRIGYRMRSDTDQKLIDATDRFFEHAATVASEDILYGGSNTLSSNSSTGRQQLQEHIVNGRWIKRTQ